MLFVFSVFFVCVCVLFVLFCFCLGFLFGGEEVDCSYLKRKNSYLICLLLLMIFIGLFPSHTFLFDLPLQLCGCLRGKQMCNHNEMLIFD